MDRAAIEKRALTIKRGADPREAKIHDYLVSKSYRPHASLDKLQEVDEHPNHQPSLNHIWPQQISKNPQVLLCVRYVCHVYQ